MTKVIFVERKPSMFVSIEKVFRIVAGALDPERFNFAFQNLEYDNSLSGIVKNLLFFHAEKADIYHLTGAAHYIALTLPKDRTVLTVHDLFLMNERKGIRRFLLKKLFVDWPIRRVKYITAISRATKDEIVKYLPDCESKIRVIENPLDPRFERVEKEFNEVCPVILQLGTVVNKNVPRLIRSLKGIKCHLRIVGIIDEAIRKELSETDIEYSTVDKLSDDELLAAYHDADIVSFCSTYEGFGLPIIEAQAAARVVVTSDISPTREVAGGGAELVDPFDEKSIRAGFERVISDKDRREALLKQGFANIERFSPRAVAERYAELYAEIIEDGVNGTR